MNNRNRYRYTPEFVASLLEDTVNKMPEREICLKYDMSKYSVSSLLHRRIVYPYMNGSLDTDYMDRDLFTRFKKWADLKTEKINKNRAKTENPPPDCKDKDKGHEEDTFYYVKEDKDTNGLPCLIDDLDYSFKKCRNPLWGDKDLPDRNTSLYCGKPVVSSFSSFCEECSKLVFKRD